MHFEALPYRNHLGMQIMRDHTFSPDIAEGEEIMTIPGEAKSIKEIMDRALQGVPPTGRDVEYFDQEDLDLINEFHAPGSLDLTDLDRLDEQVKSLKEAVERAKNEKAEAEKAAEKEKIKEELRREQEAQKQGSGKDSGKPKEES